MAKVIVTSEFYSNQVCLTNPQSLFIFGDNTKRVGQAGQAQIRYATNSLGIATKFFPTMEDRSFFSDSRYQECCTIIDEDINDIYKLSMDFNYLVFPAAGLGTGLSQLPTRAPKVYEYLCRKLDELFGIKTNPDGTLDGTYGKTIY